MLLMLAQLGDEQILSLCPDCIHYVNVGAGFSRLSDVDETGLALFGPGYGFFLGVIFFLAGAKASVVLILQGLISSFSCLFIYKLGKELSHSKKIGLIAGYLSAASFTSISLANVLLSDTLFFFLFLVGNLLFLHGLQSGQRWKFVLSGIVLGSATLTRSVAQFWPLVFLLLIFIWPVGKNLPWRLRERFGLLKKAYLAPLIALLITGMWISRNYHLYQLPVVAFAGPHGINKLVMIAKSKVGDEDYDQIRIGLEERLRQLAGGKDPSLKLRYYYYLAQADSVLSAHPSALLGTYLELIWENMKAGNIFYFNQLPQYKDEIHYALADLKLQYIYRIILWATLIGFILLIYKRQWKLLIFLGLVYFYFVPLIGFGRWQGSRLFYPAQIAWSIVIAFLIDVGLHSMKRLAKNVKKVLG